VRAALYHGGSASASSGMAEVARHAVRRDLEDRPTVEVRRGVDVSLSVNGDRDETVDRPGIEDQPKGDDRWPRFQSVGGREANSLKIEAK
ncbi:MAG: hypothetical protein ACRD1G_19580, partial [Acidimicrobiales bacterium]